MKFLNLKLTIAILCSIAIAFTACSKEEIETSNPISANDITSKQIQNPENTTADKSSATDDIDKYIWNITNETDINETVANRAECTIKICVDLGPNSTYTVFGAPQTFTYTGPYFGCVRVPFNNGETRDVEYSGSGGVSVTQKFKKYSPFSSCPLFVVNASNQDVVVPFTVYPHCEFCF